MPRITRRARDQAATKRILTGGEIGQARERAFNRVLGLPDPERDPEPRRTHDMATEADIEKRLRQGMRRG